MESRHVKSINTDKRSNKRIKFASAKERSKQASADVYRSHKRKLGATSSATREEAVHNPHRELGSQKKQRAHHLAVDDDRSKATIVALVSGQDAMVDDVEETNEGLVLAVDSSLADELDETLDRNASEVFGKFYRKVWPLVRSLPEVLHHAERIIDLMLSHILSPQSTPEVPTSPDALKDPSEAPRGYMVNHATLDILHLLAVLSRDLRHEMHPYLGSILQRIIQDLLNPPPPPLESGKQAIPLDVTLVEAAFRCMSYIFKYNTEKIVEDIETMRKHYGATLAARRELVRRLASQTFAPLIRKLKNQNDRQLHLKRVLKALVVASDGQPLTPSLKRTQSDAVDGISELIFQVVRGVPGQLHSQGLLTLRSLLTYCSRTSTSSRDGDGSALLVTLAFDLIERLFRHINNVTKVGLTDMLARILKTSWTGVLLSQAGLSTAMNAFRLFSKAATMQLSASGSKQTVEQMHLFSETLEIVFGEACFAKLSSEQRVESMRLACPIWLTLQDSHRIERCIQQCLRITFRLDDKLEAIHENEAESVRFMTLVLSRDLLPHLTNHSCVGIVGTVALAAAARLAKLDRESALLTVFAIATKPVGGGESGPQSTPRLFHDRGTAFYKVPREVQDTLLRTCLDASESITGKELCVDQLLVAIRCIPFVVSLHSESIGSREIKDLFKKTASFFVEVFVQIEKGSWTEFNPEDILVTQGLCLEGLSHLANDFLGGTGDQGTVKKTIERVMQPVENLLFLNASSLWIVRGIAAFTSLLSKVDLVLNGKVDDTFDALVSNLSHPSHELRLHTLEIMASYPTKNYVTDHADLDLIGDLDEEPSYRPIDVDGGTRNVPVGQCDMIHILLQIESMKVQLAKERPLLGLVSRVEVLGRTGKLPVIYAEAAAHHMLGLFHVKFAPLWPVVEKSLVALAEGHENDVWPAMETMLVATMKAQSLQDEEYADGDKHDICMSCKEHRLACVLWEKSHGRIVTVFDEEPLLQDGEVHRHLTTDKATVMESVWGVAEKCQQLVAKHSRVIVPAFIEFLSSQYFLYHCDDPCARELGLNSPPSESNVERKLLRKFDLQKKLLCFLRVFAAIDGPQQLIRHKFLEKIFRSFLTHQDTHIVQLSLAALFKFKPKHVMPYCGLLTGLLEKGKLRNALLSFQESLEAGEIQQEHTGLFVPIVSRVLFGRLSSRDSRSGKDSPAARRAAILSFVSLLCKEDHDIFYFVYFMVRSFVPRSVVNMKEVESYSGNERNSILDSLCDIDATKLPGAVVEGFLHLLQPFMAQLGHRIKTYIPMMASILLAICRVVAVVERDEEGTPAFLTEGSLSTTGRLRYGAIRTLCFQRLSEMFSMYAGAIDFEEFGGALWGSISLSVDLLPEMVMKAEKPPALLRLLETLSSEIQLVRILYMHQPAIDAVIKCIASTTLTPVMTTALSIVEQLLGTVIANETSKHVRGVLMGHVPLLMKQFADRLRTTDDSDQLPGTQPFKRSRPKLREATWRKELQILCRVSELLDAKDDFADNAMTSMVEDLTGLLLPFLEPGQGTSDVDKLNVIGILKRTIDRVNKECLEVVFVTVAGILGPHKGKCGIESITVRKEVTDLLQIIGTNMPSLRDIALEASKLSAVNAKRVDEVDFETIIAELNLLSKDDAGCNWQCLAGEDPMKLFPIINICFHYLYSEDGVLARASFNALKTAVNVASKHSVDNSSWLKLVESLVVPPSRAGLQARSPGIRRFYVLIIREMAIRFREHQSQNLCGDLSAFIDEDNPDLDFFVGITHVQLHRRGRAFQRLRRILNENVLVSNALTSQSLSSILLPLALHPAYESKTKVEEPFALEGIATVGAIARLLPWNKYHNIIQSILSSFARHPEQERYLVGTLCAIIDGFKFDLVTEPQGALEDASAVTDKQQTNAVWRALERRMIPKLEALLTKEKVDKSGSKTKLIRPPVVLALTKLFQKFPEAFFESKLPHVLTVLCDALRSKDSDARDLARTTLAKIVIGMDLKYFSDVIQELMITLNEGYKLHVRSATIHTILQELLSVHTPPGPEDIVGMAESSLDTCIPALMDMLQEDLFGEANERRESHETSVRYVKEAGGNKSVHSIELICRMIQFKPSRASSGNISHSSIHCVVSPLLERLRVSDIKASTIGKIKEILVRVVVGLSHNPSVGLMELFPFVYATINPYIGSHLISTVFNDDDTEDLEDNSLKISGSRAATTQSEQAKKSGKVAEWRPSTLKNPLSSKSAFDIQRKERKERRTVMDGSSAPKLTGSGRHGGLDSTDMRGLNDPATISAVIFGLNLLHASLKKLNLNEVDPTQLIAMMDPFVPLLTACVCRCKDNDVALVAMKCLMSFLRFKLPSLEQCSKSLGTQALTFLSSSGSSLNQNNDMAQACFRTLTYLINRDRDDQPADRPGISGAEGEQVLSGGNTLPLHGEQMKLLIAILSVSVSEADQHNPALGLIKAILSRKFMSPEFYELMELMLKINARSQKASLRQQSASIFVRYLLDYPMSEDRFEEHLKQIVANIGYEHTDGRLSAIELLSVVIDKIPDALLQHHAQLLFLPQVLQLVNDETKEGREAVSKCLSTLLRRCSNEVLNSFHNYTVRWCGGEGPMQVASLQVFAIFVESNEAFARTCASAWLERLIEVMKVPSQDWEVTYFSLICLEKLAQMDTGLLRQNTEFWPCIVERLIDKHPWIKLASCRIVQHIFESEEIITLARYPGVLFDIVRNVCFQINVEEEEQNDEITIIAVKTLTKALPVMHRHPELCFTDESPHAGLRDPVAWMLRRLSCIAKPKGRNRRMTVYKCFAAFCNLHASVILNTPEEKQRRLYLELMLEPLHRSHLEARNESENPAVMHKSPSTVAEEEMTESSLAQDVLQMIEEGSIPEDFLSAYAVVKTRARDKKDQRKIQVKAEAVQDPAAAAQRKTKKHEQERDRKKRRVEDRRHDRGSVKKRRSHF